MERASPEAEAEAELWPEAEVGAGAEDEVLVEEHKLCFIVRLFLGRILRWKSLPDIF